MARRKERSEHPEEATFGCGEFGKGEVVRKRIGVGRGRGLPAKF